MQKIQKSALSAIFLAAAIIFCFSVAFAKEQNTKQINAEEHQNVISTSVQKLLDAADKEKNGIGEEIRAVVQEQNESKNEIADKIDKIQKRGKVKIFLIGTDYKNIGQLRSEMVKTENQIKKLEKLADRATSEEGKTIIKEQVQSLEQEQKSIEDLIKTNESKFSLFGWAVKFLNK